MEGCTALQAGLCVGVGNAAIAGAREWFRSRFGFGFGSGLLTRTEPEPEPEPN